ncbi:MAG TPA: glycosyltransferase [Flavobacterium sp.]|nr:glycosyltransferase [Flavobacterium sp.]
MKILLVGEYSRLHNSLKEGLVALGHEVAIVGTGDYFKDFPVDYSIAPKFTSKRAFHYIHKLYSRFGINFMKHEQAMRFYFLLSRLRNYDVVQLINSDALELQPEWQMHLYKKLFRHNDKKFLLICGEDTPIIDELLRGKLKYSILTPMLKDNSLRRIYNYSLKYTKRSYRNLYEFVIQNTNGIIVSDLDYKIPMEQTNTKFTFIPNPINIDKIEFIPNVIEDKVVIFHGINTLSSIKKGSVFFEDALEIISEKYRKKVEIISASNMPYAEYIQSYNKAHIVLDQVYSYDQGYNALEAMAKGKVVFTGAETEFVQYYNLTESVNINALPDVASLVASLSELIENPEEIAAIGKRARAFIEKEHNYIKIAEKYLDAWK